MSLNDPNRLQPLTTHWANKSHSSITSASDAGTFHSAQGHAHPSGASHLDMHHVDSTSPCHDAPRSPQKAPTSPKMESIRMDRQDSGYSDGPSSGVHSQTSSRRTSTSSNHTSIRGLKFPSTRKSTRPSTKRASRSTPNTHSQTRTSTSSRRPSIQTRHTTTTYTTIHPPSRQQQYQFFQFPLLTDADADADASLLNNHEQETRPPPPPATVQYWTSDSTRRLEYAAIDAASRGVRGFFIKLVPDCILPVERRRTRFHEDDAESDAGSVRRYRLALPEEKDGVETSVRKCVESGSSTKGPGNGSAGLFRRWAAGLGFGRRSSARSDSIH